MTVLSISHIRPLRLPMLPLASLEGRPSTSRRCQDSALVLPTAPQIEQKLSAAGASSETARQLCAMFASSVSSLERLTMDGYRDALVDLRDSHDFCEGSGNGAPSACLLSRGVRDSFTRLHQRKTQEMVDSLVQLVKTSRAAKPATTKPVGVDHTPILEFAFEQSQKPSTKEKTILAQVTGLTLKQVSVWFQNRRTRSKGRVGTRNPPRTITELEERLRAQQRQYAEFQARKKLEEDSGNESHDSGYASFESSRTTAPTIQDITNMLKAFHISDDGPTVSVPPRKDSRKAAGRAASGSSENTSSGPAVKRKTVKTAQSHALSPTAGTVQSSKGLATKQPGGARAIAQMPRRVTAQEPSQDVGSTASSTTPSRSSRCRPAQKGSSTQTATDVATNATSSNKAGRPRKNPQLPARRPKASKSTRGVQVASSSSSGSSVPSLSPSSSRSSSMSTDGFPDFFSSPTAFSAALPHTEPIYYTKNANGEFVPVTAPIVVKPQIAVPPPVHVGYPDLSLDFPSLFDHPSIGPVGPQMVAPDSDPRAFSSNILGSTMEPVITTEDFSALLELLSENAGDASTSGTSTLDLTSPMPPLQGPPLNAGHDALSIAPIPDPVSDYDFGSVVWPEFDETSWSQLLGLA